MGKKRKKRRLKIKAVLIALIILFILVYAINYIMNINITNYFIEGNTYYSDLEIIKLASLDTYPSTIKTPNKKIEKKLKKNIYIKNAKVYKKHLTEVHIIIEENSPIFLNLINNKVVLKDGTEVDKQEIVPTLSYETIELNTYNDFINCMANINREVFNKVSEIKYYPDNVDKERFLFTMTDGNYVFITIDKFDLINDYNEYVKEFENNKGILYLNSGGYFKIMGK